MSCCVMGQSNSAGGSKGGSTLPPSASDLNCGASAVRRALSDPEPDGARNHLPDSSRSPSSDSRASHSSRRLPSPERSKFTQFASTVPFSHQPSPSPETRPAAWCIWSVILVASCSFCFFCLGPSIEMSRRHVPLSVGPAPFAVSQRIATNSCLCRVYMRHTSGSALGFWRSSRQNSWTISRAVFSFAAVMANAFLIGHLSADRWQRLLRSWRFWCPRNSSSISATLSGNPLSGAASSQPSLRARSRRSSSASPSPVFEKPEGPFMELLMSSSTMMASRAGRISASAAAPRSPILWSFWARWCTSTVTSTPRDGRKSCVLRETSLPVPVKTQVCPSSSLVSDGLGARASANGERTHRSPAHRAFFPSPRPSPFCRCRLSSCCQGVKA
mmetsp:Transcript_43996/g.125480  ORF Transcript_43996/g.125480 Transcript_43996/m.125480 type:complete len:387 (-) Transcript_43996:1857-3017(-)